MKMVLCLPLMFMAPCALAGSDDPVSKIEGLWAEKLDFGPRLQGELTVQRDDGGWRMMIGGETAESGTLEADFADGSRFSGESTDDIGAISGWWTQPPGFSGQAYATPLRLERDSSGIWRGAVIPLPQEFTLFLKVLRSENGGWLAAFRNPEYNLNGGSSLFSVDMDGEIINFSAGGGAKRHEGRYDDDEKRIVLPWPRIPQALTLTKANSNGAEKFTPRADQTYRYRKPEQIRDGWRTAKAGRTGMDEAMLGSLVQSIIDSDPAAARPQLIHSLLVARRGKLVLEEYFYGYDRETPHDIRSAGKTFASAMLGALRLEGNDIGPDTRIGDIFAAQAPFQNPDPRKNEITLEDLLTHTSGLDCNDNDDASPGNEGVMQNQQGQADWIQYALDLPMAHAPGDRYAYCTAGIHLAGGALSAASGESIPALFNRLIAQPLQFGRYHWNLSPDGAGYMGGGAYIRPRDLLKLGQTYLNGGVFNGRRIVSGEWVDRSTAAHVDINEDTTGMDAQTFAETTTRGADGLAWHRYPVKSGDRVIEAYEANGNGGQFLIVVPEYDLAVVITGGNYRQGGIWSRWRDNIVGDGIIAAAQ